MSKLFLGVAALMSTSLGGCATIMNGTNQPAEFQSEPAGATIELANRLTCETPCKFEMKRGKDSKVVFTRDGYQTAEVYIQSRTGGGTFGNVLAGGIIGGVVDGSNGASNHLYPDPVFVRLVPIGSTDQAVLLNKKGEIISTVAQYNAGVAADVEKGLREQGLYPTQGQ